MIPNKCISIATVILASALSLSTYAWGASSHTGRVDIVLLPCHTSSAPRADIRLRDLAATGVLDRVAASVAIRQSQLAKVSLAIQPGHYEISVVQGSCLSQRVAFLAYPRSNYHLVLAMQEDLVGTYETHCGVAGTRPGPDLKVSIVLPSGEELADNRLSLTAFDIERAPVGAAILRFTLPGGYFHADFPVEISAKSCALGQVVRVSLAQVASNLEGGYACGAGRCSNPAARPRRQLGDTDAGPPP